MWRSAPLRHFARTQSERYPHCLKSNDKNVCKITLLQVRQKEVVPAPTQDPRIVELQYHAAKLHALIISLPSTTRI
jgi:hypothetical protein